MVLVILRLRYALVLSIFGIFYNEILDVIWQSFVPSIRKIVVSLYKYEMSTDINEHFERL